MYEKAIKDAEVNPRANKEAVIVNGETAIKPYFYMRNGLLHIRYVVDRAMELSKEEVADIKKDFAERPYDKQSILARKWNFFSEFVNRPLLNDGIKASDYNVRSLTEDYINGNYTKGNYDGRR